ncbi:hypothetical protein RB599_004393 [Gaeumannomyces hyphopodioides]
MSSQKASSSKQAWRDHKMTILALAENHTMRDVEKIMWDEHRFKANQNQYEYHLRIWGFQKNIDTKQWRRVFEVYDALVELHGEVQVLVRGEALSSAALQKRRHMYASQQRGASTNAVPQIVSFQARKSDGQWTFVAESEPCQEAGAYAALTPQPGHTPPRATLVECCQTGSDDSLGPGQQPKEVPLSKAPGEGAITATNQSHTITSANDDSPAELAQPSQTPHAGPLTPSDAALGLLGAPSACVSSPGALRLGHESPKALARRERLHSPCPQSAHEFLATLLEGVFSPIENGLRGNQIFQAFLRGASPTGLHQSRLTFAPDALLQPLQTLLPDARLGYIDGDCSLNVLLFRRLLFSLANANTGLESAYGEEIIRVLGGSTGGAALFSHILANARGWYGLAIAESLLKAAICAQNADAVRRITRTSTVDITKIRFEGGSNALEKAVSLRNSSLLMTVLSSGEFDRQFISEQDVCCIQWERFPYPEKIVSLVRETNITKSDLYFRHFCRFHPHLAYQVIVGMLPAKIVRLKEIDIALTELFLEVGEIQLVELLSHILKGHSTKTKINQLHGVISFALLKISAGRGHTKVFQLLLPWVSLDVLLSASIRSGNRDLVVFLLSQQSGMDEPSQDFENDGPWGHCDHPLAEAIRSRDGELIRLIEEARCQPQGILSRHLQGPCARIQRKDLGFSARIQGFSAKTNNCGNVLQAVGLNDIRTTWGTEFLVRREQRIQNNLLGAENV